ncbi:helix-turn-helix domain-containing protein [Deminuibacter soli]|uniref:HTH cro/C1-type domain-containing protein n=1 Tax=Deminuibacter soli TaxID=2291815 RepID=A0A3E1NQJ8_9BACT|nr:helix-turn-helix domain-containing protein [Deminuibacter soli]RFM30068.1 hypothetical protein DXN05_03590 [Deminuibacter soli]
MSYSEDISDLLNKIKTDFGFTQEEIAQRLGYTRTYISDILKKGGNQKFLNRLDSFYNSLGIAYKKVSEKTNNEVREPFEEYTSNKKELQGSDTTLQALFKLSEANNTLAEANKALAESNRTLADNNRDLVQMVKAIAGGSSEIPASVEARFQALLELTAEVAAGKNYKSVQEASADMHRLYNVYSGQDIGVK